MIEPTAAPSTTDDRDELLAFIVAHQTEPATATAYLGDTTEGVTGELDGLDQPWLETARVVRDGAGTLVGAALAEWDVDVHRAWVYGPWADTQQFATLAEPLLRAVAAQCPPEITSFEFSGDVAHTGMSDLAERLGWRGTKVNHAFEIPAERAAAWPTARGVRPATDADLAALASLHEPEFPDTYATTAQLLTRHRTLVVERDGRVVGYAAGQLQGDGQAYVDFMAVDAAHRGQGLARGLLGELARALVASGSPGKVHLTVEDDRAPAVALYTSLGMTRAISLRGYRGALG